MEDIFSKGAGFNNALPSHPGIYPHTALEVIGLAAAINSVVLPGDPCVLHEGAVVAHDENDGVFGDSKAVDFIDYLTDPLIDFDQNVSHRSAVKRVVLAAEFLNEREREKRPVVEEERFILFGESTELFERVALVALVHFPIFFLRPGLAGLHFHFIEFSFLQLYTGNHISRVGHK